MPWDEAVALVGSEEQLKQGRDPGTISGYRKAGVPIQEIGEEVLKALRAREAAPAPAADTGDAAPLNREDAVAKLLVEILKKIGDNDPRVSNLLEDVRRSLDRGRADRLRRGLESAS